MPKLRQNIVTGKWVVIAPERAKRPEDFVMASAPKRHIDAKCPFCFTGSESAYKFSIKDAETENVYVIPNKYPAFTQDEEIIEEGGDFYFSTKAVGGHEVIVLKKHETEIYEGGWELINELLGVYQNRYLYYQKDPCIEYSMPIIWVQRPPLQLNIHIHSFLLRLLSQT
ncbi:MAG: galactose-1-phosphate uridyl transferase, Gal-1-P uridylyltransferase [Candidatus Berkelbacteria bacterium]|nr:galactose-1-phosphate uridyl transferase, Gal-1-P uridylyltransferase [Candidatus Berkelbacteria bacterium]